MTADHVALAVAPLEEVFWQNFCDIIGLAADERNDKSDPKAVRQRVANRIGGKTAAEWSRLFDGRDVCVEVVQDAKAVLDDPHFKARGVFGRALQLQSGRTIPALPVPISPGFLSSAPDTYPAIGSTDAAAEDIWKRS